MSINVEDSDVCHVQSLQQNALSLVGRAVILKIKNWIMAVSKSVTD